MTWRSGTSRTSRTSRTTRDTTAPAARLSDPSASRAVLIEAHAFTRGGAASRDRQRHLDDRPSVAAGCRRLAELFRDPEVWGLPEEHCAVVSQPTRDSMLEAVHRAAAEATDTLVVYYAGHGLLYPLSGGLHLAVPETTKDKSFTAVKYDDLREILLSATRVRRKVVILDCCFSGTALRGHLSAGGDTIRLADVEGTSVLAASHATKQALAPPGERYPAFTGELIALLEEGDPDAPELLTMADLYDRVDRALMRKNRPRPQQLNRDRGAHISIARNRAPRQEPPEPDDETTAAPESHGLSTRQRALAAATLALAAIAGLTFWLLPNGDGGRGADGKGPSCGKAHSTFDSGDGTQRREPSVDSVHNAACRGDFDTMEVAMDRGGFDGTGFSAAAPDEVIASWKKRPDRASFLHDLATLLESEPTVDQGGLTFSHGDQVATWQRGPGTVPDSHYRWTGYFRCDGPDSDHPVCKPPE
ncbi:caspase family protein [Streptomyces sp. Inha503]|uniref:caspase family protein n=1 Tax=Streptomyces sp. Inha503 TaxID=3383314 RepID=UPI0039A1DAC4